MTLHAVDRQAPRQTEASPKQQRRPGLRLAALIAGLALIAAACSGSDSDTSADADTTTERESEDTTTSTEAAAEDTSTTEEAEADSDEVGEDEPTAEGGFAAVTAAVEDFVEENGLDGAGLIVVDRDDGVLYHEHFGAFTEDRISVIASSSKMISAGVLLRLQEQGLLDIDQPLIEVVDWATDNPDVTTAQLLSNSSGLVGLGPDLLYPPYICQWGPDDELEACGETVFSGEGDDDDVIPPDTEFRYGGAQWQVAGAVAETVSGSTWAELIEEIYIEPCGVDSLGYLSLGAIFTGAPGYPTAFAGDPDGVPETLNPNIEGGAYITTGDYGELLLMHLRGGMCGDTPVLTQESLDIMHSDRIAAAYDGDAFDADTGYGMGWWVDRETGRITDPGAWGAIAWLDLDNGYGGYLVIEDDGSTTEEFGPLLGDLVHEAVTGSG